MYYNSRTCCFLPSFLLYRQLLGKSDVSLSYNFIQLSFPNCWGNCDFPFLLHFFSHDSQCSLFFLRAALALLAVSYTSSNFSCTTFLVSSTINRRHHGEQGKPRVHCTSNEPTCPNTSPDNERPTVLLYRTTEQVQLVTAKTIHHFMGDGIEERFDAVAGNGLFSGQFSLQLKFWGRLHQCYLTDMLAPPPSPDAVELSDFLFFYLF